MLRLLMVAVLLALVVVALTRGAVVRESRNGLVSRAASISDLGDTSTQGRLNFLASALRIFREHPIIGTGAGTFGALHPAYQQDVRFYARDAHNLYLQNVAEMGILGLVALAMLIGSIASCWSRTLRTLRGRVDYPLVAGMEWGLAAFGFHGALDMNWAFPANPAMVFALVGVLTPYFPQITGWISGGGCEGCG